MTSCFPAKTATTPSPVGLAADFQPAFSPHREIAAESATATRNVVDAEKNMRAPKLGHFWPQLLATAFGHSYWPQLLATPPHPPFISARSLP